MPVSKFPKHGNRIYSTCKPCKVEAQRKRTYGLTGDEARELYGNKCNICDIVLPRRFCIDHDHVTGKVRGVLCNTCNAGLGKLGDTVEGLKKAILYLER